MQIPALILFLTLLVFALGKSPIFQIDRAGIAIIGAALTIGTGVISFDEAAQAVDYRTIVLLFSMMIITSYLNITGFFHLVGKRLIRRLQTKRQLLIAVIFTTGMLSAFFMNDIVCLLFTPIVILICKQVDLNPVPYLLGTAMASNIGSAATLIGNPQNILIGSLSGIHFAWYIAVALPLSVIGLVLIYFIIARVYRNELEGPFPAPKPLSGAVHHYLVKKGIIAVLLVLGGFLLGYDPAIVASLGAAFLLITRRINPNKIYMGIDFSLLVVFIGLFVMIGGVEKSGLFMNLLKTTSFESTHSFPLFSLFTVVLSNLVSNVPAVMLLRFFIPSGAGDLWWASMAVFSTFAGNLTLIGSMANLIVAEIAKKHGVEIRFLSYLKIGLPLTLILVSLAMIYFQLFMSILRLQ
ncbi:SLC13 family permease [Thermicanus aegyptius]|uniref:SLC13 family permease n=1 Tax=Thermicanus aegyptius TaxID=94009 RepID=UPI0004110E16|nr:anion transporter [Thermicanus aegyptius]